MVRRRRVGRTGADRRSRTACSTSSLNLGRRLPSVRTAARCTGTPPAARSGQLRPRRRSGGASASRQPRTRHATSATSILLENTNKGKSQQLTVGAEQAVQTTATGRGACVYTYTNANEVSPLTSSTVGSQLGSTLGLQRQRGSHRDRPATRSRTASPATAELEARVLRRLRHHRVGWSTKVAAGRPYSYIFDNDANGDGRTFNDLFYIPTGPGDVRSARQPRRAPQADGTGCVLGLASNSNEYLELATAGSIAERNGVRGELGQHSSTCASPRNSRASSKATRPRSVVRHPERRQPAQQGLGPRRGLRLPGHARSRTWSASAATAGTSYGCTRGNAGKYVYRARHAGQR